MRATFLAPWTINRCQTTVCLLVRMVFPCTAVPTRTNSLALTGLRSSSLVRTNLRSIIIIQPLIMDSHRPKSRPSLIWPVRNQSRAARYWTPPTAKRSIKNLSIQAWVMASHFATLMRKHEKTKTWDQRASRTKRASYLYRKAGISEIHQTALLTMLVVSRRLPLCWRKKKVARL